MKMIIAKTIGDVLDNFQEEIRQYNFDYENKLIKAKEYIDKMKFARQQAIINLNRIYKEG